MRICLSNSAVGEPQAVPPGGINASEIGESPAHRFSESGSFGGRVSLTPETWNSPRLDATKSIRSLAARCQGSGWKMPAPDTKETKLWGATSMRGCFGCKEPGSTERACFGFAGTRDRVTVLAESARFSTKCQEGRMRPKEVAIRAPADTAIDLRYKEGVCS